MKTYLILLSAVIFSAALLSAEPNGPMGRVGQVLILDTEQILEGDIVEIGTTIRVKRPVGEVLLPRDRVLFIGKSFEDAYGFMVRRANLHDADEQVRLSRWCVMNSMRPHALKHAQAAQAMRPKSTEIQHMVDALTVALARPMPMPKPMSEIQTVGNEVEIPAPPLNFNSDAYPLYVTRVQPILMNACASCHASENHTSKFRLQRVSDGGNRRGTQFNLNAVLTQIDRDRLGSSPMLIKSLTLHGDMARPAIQDRLSPTFRTLERFARIATNTPDSTPLIFAAPTPAIVPAAMRTTVPATGSVNPGEPGMLPASILGADLVPMPMAKSEPFGVGGIPANDDDVPPAVVPASVPFVTPKANSLVPLPTPMPVTMPKPAKSTPVQPMVDDPFDPSQFNAPKGKGM